MFTFIVGIQFWHICFSGTFPFLPYSHTLLVFLSLSLTPLSFSLSLSLFNSLPLSLTHSLPHLSLYLSHTLLITLSLSLPLLSLFLSLRFFPPFSLFPFKTIQPFTFTASFLPFLSFQLRLFNFFNDHSPSPLSTPVYNKCTNISCFLCTEPTVIVSQQGIRKTEQHIYLFFIHFIKNSQKMYRVWFL